MRSPGARQRILDTWASLRPPHLTSSPKYPADAMGPAENHLERGLVKLYWDGVANELPGLLHLLRREATFTTSDEAREEEEEEGQGAGPQRSPFESEEEVAAYRSRARELLRGAEWLDIDKVVEDRDGAVPPPPQQQQQRRLSSAGFADRKGKKRWSPGRRLLERMKRAKTSMVMSAYGAGKSPYARMHMAVRIGTVMFENGVAHTNGGVLISNRLPPHPDACAPSKTRALLVTGKKKRLVYSQSRSPPPPWAKTTMKHVAGHDFCGLTDAQGENHVVDALVRESRRVGGACTPQACSCDREQMRGGIGRIVAELERHLGDRVRLYMGTVAGRLLDPDVALAWHPKNNNCQAFCESLVDGSMTCFSLAPPPRTPTPMPMPMVLEPDSPVAVVVTGDDGASTAESNPFVADSADRLKDVSRDSRLDTTGGFAEFLSSISPALASDLGAAEPAGRESKHLSIYMSPPSQAPQRGSIHERL